MQKDGEAPSGPVPHLRVRAAPWAAGRRRGPTRCCGAALGPWGPWQAAGLRCCGRYAPLRVTGPVSHLLKALQMPLSPKGKVPKPLGTGCGGRQAIPNHRHGGPRASLSGTLLALSSARQRPQPSSRALPGSFGSTCSVLTVPPDGTYLAGRSLALPLSLPQSLAACFPSETPPAAQPLRPPL